MEKGEIQMAMDLKSEVEMYTWGVDLYEDKGTKHHQAYVNAMSYAAWGQIHDALPASKAPVAIYGHLGSYSCRVYGENFGEDASRKGNY
jgi:hypothetical protein